VNEETLEARLAKLEGALKLQAQPTISKPSTSSSCCNCAPSAKLAQLSQSLDVFQQSLAGLVASVKDTYSSCSVTTTVSPFTTTTSASACASSASVPCLVHYWPIRKQSVTDTITCKNATSSNPLFAKDRFGVANEAIWVNSSAANGWHLPQSKYFQGDTTVTMWVKKITCRYGYYRTDFLLISYKKK
jgi:hypothetical protein